MRKVKNLIIGISLLFLGACATGASTQTTEENTIMSSMQSLAIAGKAIITYTALPVCGTVGASAICSDPVTVTKMKSAFQAATDVLISAQKQAQAGLPVDQTAIAAAMSALTALTHTK